MKIRRRGCTRVEPRSSQPECCRWPSKKSPSRLHPWSCTIFREAALEYVSVSHVKGSHIFFFNEFLGEMSFSTKVGAVQSSSVNVSRCTASPLGWCAEKSFGAGILMTTYGFNLRVVSSITKSADSLAHNLRKYTDAKIALFTTSEPAFHHFNIILKIPEEFMPTSKIWDVKKKFGVIFHPQWSTRILCLAASPFELTVYVDADATVCTSPHPLFRSMHAVDFAVANSHRDMHTRQQCSPHNYLMAFRRTSATQRFFSEWFTRHVDLVNSSHIQDDQRSLHACLKRASYLDWECFDASLATGFHHIGWHTQERCGMTHMVPRNSVPPLIHSSMRDACQILNTTQGTARALVTNYNGSDAVLTNRFECAEFVTLHCGNHTRC